MNQIAEIYTGITYRKEDVSNTGVPILSPKNIKDYKLDVSKLIKIDKPIPKKYILEKMIYSESTDFSSTDAKSQRINPKTKNFD